jgi:flagellar basal-body rod modification protein FlgD
MMITQLKNQDPTQPTSNADLLQEMSQIGQLQSQQSLQTNLQSMVLQNQIGSASNFIGKSVTGLGTNNSTINGVVDSVHIENGAVNLVLDSGASLALSNLTDVDGGTTPTTATTPVSTGT